MAEDLEEQCCMVVVEENEGEAKMVCGGYVVALVQSTLTTDKNNDTHIDFLIPVCEEHRQMAELETLMADAGVK